MMRGPTSALSSGSPIPVLLSAKHPWSRGSGGIRDVSAGVIAPISHPSRFVPNPPPALRSRAKSRSGVRGIMMRGSDKCAFVRLTHPGATQGQTPLAAGFWWDPGRQCQCDRAHFPSYRLRSRPSSRVEM
ncbi:hypothetical protein Ancab_002192 [Ancistrocladus abbreviatus]